ncbi:MAG: DISARM system SNF2-like helicase DrmD [Candidatus Promineifilaceae bacterium]
MPSTPNIPKIGQLAIVRNRQFVVDAVSDGTINNGLTEPFTAPPVQQHLVSLTSVEDDALGEALQVIWELEPGARIVEQNSLPNPVGFDTPTRFDAFMNAVRWGIISAEDDQILQSPFRSGVELKAYQLDPLVRSLSMPRVNLLIADDVGLGKTVETGMVMQEMLIRGRARTALIVCPAGLQLHWQEQMRDKFGLTFRIIDSAAMKLLRRRRGLHVNPWAHYPRLITSIDYLKRDRPMRLLREVLPKDGEIKYPRPFDILIVDEAHNVAPASSGKARKYATESQRTRAIRDLAPHFEHKLFLSATPHNGYKESFTALLELLDNQRFARGIEPNPTQLRRVMVRRLKTELMDNGVPLFKPRVLTPLEVFYSEKEKAIHRKLKRYGELRAENARDSGERFATDFVIKLLKKRLFSSAAAFHTTLLKHQASLAGKSAEKRKKPRPDILRRKIQAMQEDSSNDDELEEAVENVTVSASSAMVNLTSAETSLLTDMINWASHAAAQGETKFDTLINWLHKIVKPNGKWNNERVILFTEYRATQKWLYEWLLGAGLDRVKLIYGGMDKEEREAIKAEFQSDPALDSAGRGVRILLATDAASEGIDLQNYCHRLLHVEIPWNPNRLEQRNGRIDRHGQQFAPEIFHFVPAGFSAENPTDLTQADTLAADLEFLMRVAFKVEQIREDLGSVGSVIAEQVEAAMLGKRRTLDTARAESQAVKAKARLRFEKQLQADIDKFHLTVLKTRDQLALEPANVQYMVQTALALAGQLPLAPTGEQHVYKMPFLTGSWRDCTHGLAHPHTREIRPITFDADRAYRQDDVVYIHLNHPLVQQSIRLLRAEVAKHESTNAALYRVTSRSVPKHHLPNGKPAVLAFARIVITGGDNQRLHEELIVAGGTVTHNAPRPFRRITALRDLDNIVAHFEDEPLSTAHRELYQRLWPKLKTPLFDSLNRRGTELMGRYEERLIERAEKQSQEIEAVLNDLKRTIEQELAVNDRPQQLELRFTDWSENERQQLRKDYSALRTRLDAIPAEIKQEKKRIIDRVLSPTPRLFPISVVFINPSS